MNAFALAALLQVADPGAAPATAAPSPPASAIAPAAPLIDPRPVVRPRLLRGPMPQMPPDALRLGHQGTVVVVFHVQADGRAGEGQVHTSSRSPVLDRAALRGLRVLQFEPARNGKGEVVIAPMALQLNFLEWPEGASRCGEMAPRLAWTRTAWADSPQRQWALLAPHLKADLNIDPLPAADADRAALMDRAEQVATACAASTPAQRFGDAWRAASPP